MEIEAVAQVLARHPEIQLAYVFGSVANGVAGPESDLDIAVRARAPLGSQARQDLIAELAERSGRPIDLIDLHVAGEPVLGEILKGRRVRGSEAAHARLLSRRLIDAADFRPYLERLLAERRRAWIG